MLPLSTLAVLWYNRTMTKYEGNVERVEVRFPSMTGNQQQVGDWFNRDVPADLTGETVFLFGNRISTTNEVVVDEVVRLLKVRNATKVLVYGVSDEQKKWLTTSAKRRKVDLAMGTSNDLMLP
jgi:hypothetical protein